MRNCEQMRSMIHPYVDGELQALEQLAFEAHLLECEGCRLEYDAVREVVNTVRGSAPLYPAGSSLSAKLDAFITEYRNRHRKRNQARVWAMGAAFTVTLLVFAVLPGLRSQRFTSFAADTHLRYAEGSLPLDVSSDRPSVVSSWLKIHLPFQLALPDFSPSPGEPKSYSLAGARVMNFDGQDIAYLAYTMESRPISLLVSAEADVVPSDGETYRSGKLAFHFSSQKGLKLITWRDRGLSYALVSDLQVEGGQSCVVCHGSRTERQKFENLLRLGSPTK